jgi:hypothetical protein
VPRWIRGEDHAVSVIVERVEKNGHRIVAGKLQVGAVVVGHQELVALQDPGDDILSPRVVGHDPYVERLVIKDDADGCALCGECALNRFLLAQSREHRCPDPYLLVQESVHAHGAASSGGNPVRPGIVQRGGLGLKRRRGPATQPSPKEDRMPEKVRNPPGGPRARHWLAARRRRNNRPTSVYGQRFSRLDRCSSHQSACRSVTHARPAKRALR